MHQPRPFGLFGEIQSDDDGAAVELLARRLTNAKELGGLGSLRMVQTLPSGALAIAQDMGGVFKVFVSPKQSPEVDLFETGKATPSIPMLISGSINNGRPRQGAGVKTHITKTTQRRLSGYKKDAKKEDSVPEFVEMDRFVVEHNVRVYELVPRLKPEGATITQYDSLRPTWYSGAMAEVVQIVGGYGTKPEKPKGDSKKEKPEDAMAMKLPAHVRALIESQLGSTTLPGYTGAPPNSGEILYDYKVNNTNAVGFDSDKKPWLLQIGPSGIYAMPLPIVPATTTKAFREYIEEVDDDEILWALDRFGGLPSGETFPGIRKNFDAWVRAGVIVKICDIDGFYSFALYSSALGWAVNSSGNEAVNTCYLVDPDTRACTGLTFKINLKLAPSKHEGKLSEEFKDDKDDNSRDIFNRYLAAIYQAVNQDSALGLPIKYKLLRREVSEVVSRARDFYRFALDDFGDTSQFEAMVKREVDYWDKLEAEPIAVHSGSISMINYGYLHWMIPGIKFPEPFMEGCISFMAPAKQRTGTPRPDKTDTIVLAYYTGDEMKVVRYFFDDRAYKEEGGPPEECMIVGSWDYTMTKSDTTIRGNVYTSDFDARSAAADESTNVKLQGRDLGYESTPKFEFDDSFGRPGTIWRSRFYSHDSVETKVQGYTKVTGAIMPYMHRNAVIHACEERTTEKKVTTNTGVAGAMRDPTDYRYWTHDFYFAWHGAVTGPQSAVPVYPKDGNPVWVVQENYSPGQCTDFADNGPWISLPADYTWLIHPNKNAWHHSGGGDGWQQADGDFGPRKTNPKTTVKLTYGDVSGFVDAAVSNYASRVHKRVPDPQYFLLSPDPTIGVAYKDATGVAAGESKYASVSESAEAGGLRKHWGNTRMADHKKAHHFIGVINE